MKKLIAIMLALLFCGAALAEGAFPEGIAWGMSPDEVVALEGEDACERFPVEDGMEIVTRAGVSVEPFGGVEANLNCVFRADQLALCGYGFDSSDLDVDGALAALTGLYGEPTDSDFANMMELRSLLMGVPDESVDEGLEEGAFYAGWTLEDGIYLILTDNYGSVEVAWFETNLSHALAGGGLGEPAPALDD